MLDLIYLDNAATTYPKPDSVYDFMNHFYRERGVSPGRATYDAGIEVEQILIETRQSLTNMFGGNNPKRLTFGYNASDSLNTIIFGMVKPGDHVITTTLEHNSVLRPLNHRVRAGEIEVTQIRCDKDGYVDPDDFKKAFRKNTRLVLVVHASNVIGTVQPITEIGAHCKGAGIPFAIDASQTAGALPIDMAKQNVDVVAFTGHKSLMGPTGIGGICSREGVEMRSVRFGGTGVNSVNKFHLEEYPYRLECGTLNMLGVLGLHAGQKWLAEQKIENIHRQEQVLWTRLRDGLKKLPGVQMYCADADRPRISVLSCNVPGWDAGDVGKLLDVDFGIGVRTGLQCAPMVHEEIGTTPKGTVRFSIGPFNTAEHIDKAIAAMAEISTTPPPRKQSNV